MRAFRDSNGDGHGDLRGVIERLDYLVELGVDCVWLLPIYPSPLVDDGYDISDYYGVAPEYGTVDDFRELVEAAHARGMRIIADLVLNHTSDQHPWFEASRRRRSPYTRLLRLERQSGALLGRADHLPGHRNLELDVGSRAPSSITGTASIASSPI